MSTPSSLFGSDVEGDIAHVAAAGAAAPIADAFVGGGGGGDGDDGLGGGAAGGVGGGGGGGGGGAQGDALASLVGDKFLDFLEAFEVAPDGAAMDDGYDGEEGTGDAAGGARVRPYVEQLLTLKERGRSTVYVDFEHLLSHDDELAEIIEEEYYRTEPYLRQAVGTFIARHHPDEARAEDGTPRLWSVSLANLPRVRKLRDLRSDGVGALLALRGTITRTSEVRPELLAAHFNCGNCGAAVPDVEQQFRYTEPGMCGTCGNKRAWNLSMDRSRFIDWQRVRVQEPSAEIPAGSMPRTVDVVLRGDLVETAKAGDTVTFTGTLIVVPDATVLAKPGERVEALS